MADSASMHFPADPVSKKGWLLPSHAGAGATLSLAEQIADRLASDIVHGTYAPGERLQEQAIATAFEVSRGPVRDALRILEREGLVAILARHGASVIQLSRKDTLNIFAVRAGLFGLAAEAMAERRDPTVLAQLKERTATLRLSLASHDPQAFLDIIYANSMFIAESCGNDVLRNFLYSLGRQTLYLTLRAMAVPANQERWYANWRVLAKAIGTGEPGNADAAGRTLVRDLQQAVLAMFHDEDMR